MSCSRAFSALTLFWEQQEGVLVCLERGAGLHTAQLMPLPLSEMQINFTFLVPAHPDGAAI